MSKADRMNAAQCSRGRKQEQRRFRSSQRAAGLGRPSHTTRPNRTSPYQSVEQEQEARSEAVVEYARLIRAQLPTLLAKLSQIPDPRNPMMIQHTLNTLMVYGILMFVLQTGSRRKTNEKLTAPAMKTLLMELFPDLASMPHHDTLLARIQPEGIEAAQLALVNRLIRDKKFSDYLIDHHYLIAIDGTQKLVRQLLPDDPWLERQVGAEDTKRTQYYV
ncbi:MAG: transposase family protein, partial [Candidatus Atribacteria bacterium]|nr:transposase family protein [Candidatus Atribacteria bacterium]